ncbi:MAG: 4-(cytidine 5'-diphospho)-2-C-methyl-D-erythritol kinase [Bacteroidota bacterium]
MLCFPNCKINIGLYITRKREDGYHDLETIFYPVQLQDALEAVPATIANTHISGKAVAGNTQDNLVWKAYTLLQQHYPAQVPPMDIYLHKVIPMGAGLGGGSADGAFMLQLLNDICELGLSKEQLASYALQLGSDCPFFIYNTPQYATGRGEQMSPINIDLSSYSLQLICPQLHVSTAKAFRMISPKPAPYDLRQLASLPITAWKGTICNDFEAAVFAMHPEIGSIKQQLYDQGAIYAAMSGSGSAVYAVMSKGSKALITAPVAFEQVYVL